MKQFLKLVTERRDEVAALIQTAQEQKFDDPALLRRARGCITSLQTLRDRLNEVARWYEEQDQGFVETLEGKDFAGFIAGKKEVVPSAKPAYSGSGGKSDERSAGKTSDRPHSGGSTDEVKSRSAGHSPGK